MHRALVRPELIAGCDRRLFYLLCIVSAVLGGPAGVFKRNWMTTVLAVFVFAVGRAGLRELAKLDPQWWDVRERARKYAAAYVARASWYVPRKGP